MANRVHVRYDRLLLAPSLRLLAFPILLLVSACASTQEYYGAPIEALVVDSETGAPIEGALVLALWKYKWGSFVGTVGDGHLVVMETTSDKNGRFAFPAWGPERLPSAKLDRSAYIDDYADPDIAIFKPGYKRAALDNYSHTRPITERLRISAWNGKTVRLEKPKDMQEYVHLFESFNSQASNAVRGTPSNHRDCEWRKIPKTIKVIHEERKRLEELGVRRKFVQTLDEGLFANEEYHASKGCGSVRAFLQEVLR
jgi:hypothetical protein